MSAHELKLAQEAMRHFGKDAIYKPDSEKLPCRVQVDMEMDHLSREAPVRDITVSFLVQQFPKYEPRKTVEVPELSKTFVLNKVLDDDGYIRVVSCSIL
ncbi:hypothetical protein ACJJJB_00055 (plasmid) [Microbulbifer sp. ANSA001]|uniref:hypothetical protein n=1 Tax=Microbulbifer sp. ANSA001 TaxID=3243358 RepID=UPI0040432E7D